MSSQDPGVPAPNVIPLFKGENTPRFYDDLHAEGQGPSHLPVGTPATPDERVAALESRLEVLEKRYARQILERDGYIVIPDPRSILKRLFVHDRLFTDLPQWMQRLVTA